MTWTVFAYLSVLEILETYPVPISTDLQAHNAESHRGDLERPNYSLCFESEIERVASGTKSQTPFVAGTGSSPSA